MKKAIIFGVFIFFSLLFINNTAPSYAQTPAASCTGIRTTQAASLSNLFSERDYTFEGTNCQNASTYKWVFSRGSCPSSFAPTIPTSSTFPMTMPAFPINLSSCSFTVGLQVCNDSNQCSQYYSVNPVVRYTIPTNAKQWQFNVRFSCANGATPVDTITQASWGYANSTNQSCVQRPEYPTSGSSQSTIANYNLTYIPTTCTVGTFGAYKAHTGESAIFKSASSTGITAKNPNTQYPDGEATWDLNTLQNGTYTLEYELPASSCPTPTAVQRPSPCNGIGDVTKDGFVTEADALLVLRYLAGLENFDSDLQRRANVNGGEINNTDALAIRRFIAGIDNTFPACSLTPTAENTCPLKPQGDANCDQEVNIQDFLVWKAEFLTQTPHEGASSFKSNFNSSQGNIDIQDFLVWKAGFLNPNIAH